MKGRKKVSNSLPWLKLFLICCIIILSSTKSVFSYSFSDKLQLPLPPDSLPLPKEVKNLLFYLQRNLDHNTVVYTLNTTANKTINPVNPLSVYWIKYEEEGIKQEISLLEKKLAYGVNVKKIAEKKYEIRLVSYPQQLLYLTQTVDGNYQVLTLINGRNAVLKRIFVSVKGGGFLSPSIKFIELNGIEAASGKAINHRIYNPGQKRF